MLTAATAVAVVLLVLGSLLTGPLRFSAGALGIASGIVIAGPNGVSEHLDESSMLVTEKVFGFPARGAGCPACSRRLSDPGVIHLTRH
jgi:hypothetical protein